MPDILDAPEFPADVRRAMDRALASGQQIPMHPKPPWWLYPKRLASVRDVVLELDGQVAVAAMLGIKRTAVLNWIAANEIPAKYYFFISDALKRRWAIAPKTLFNFLLPPESEHG